MSISKMYTKRVSYKLAIDALAEEYVNINNEYDELRHTLTLMTMAHTLAVTMGLVTAFVREDLAEKVNELRKVA